MLQSLNRLYRRRRNLRELRSLDCRMQDDIGVGWCKAPDGLDTNALLLMHHGPFDR